jgi:S1-C subfamily serine protease
MSNRVLSAIVCAALAAAWAGPAGADDDVKQAGKIMQDYAKAVVAVEAVLTVSAEGPLAAQVGANQEQKVQITGTVVDPSGLTLVSYVSLNPASALKNVKVRGSGGQEMSLSLKGELSDVKICLPDGTEIPARVVMKDEDLDMAFIMPKEKLDNQAAGQIQAVDLAKPAPKAQRLDQVVRLGRLGKDMNRELVIDLDRISAIITKPRMLYIVGGAQSGTPVFAMNGELLGIVVFHKKPGSGGSGRSGQNIGGMPAVLPTEDVKKIADQAREEAAKAPATTQPTTKEAQTTEAPTNAAK